jgi:hypothetical protein
VDKFSAILMLAGSNYSHADDIIISLPLQGKGHPGRKKVLRMPCELFEF